MVHRHASHSCGRVLPQGLPQRYQPSKQLYSPMAAHRPRVMLPINLQKASAHVVATSLFVQHG